MKSLYPSTQLTTAPAPLAADHGTGAAEGPTSGRNGIAAVDIDDNGTPAAAGHGFDDHGESAAEVLLTSADTGTAADTSSDSYFGGKGQPGVYHTIINNIRPHTCFYEPFAGHAAISRLKKPAEYKTILTDLDEEAVAWLRLQKWEGRTDILLRDAFDVVDILRGLKLDNTVVYLDPPYPHSTRTSDTRYRYELTDDDHRRLLTLARRLRCDVLISTYPNDLYLELLHDWRLVEFEGTDRSGKKRTEWLFCNFPEPVELHDYRYIGPGYRQRLDFRRKKARWRRNFAALPILEQRALLLELQDELSTRGEGAAAAPDFALEDIGTFTIERGLVRTA